MNNVEDFFINVDKIRSYQEIRRSIKLKPLLLLQDLNLFLRRNFLIQILRIFLIKVFTHFISHLLQFKFNLFSFLFNHVLKFFIIICFFSKSYTYQRITIKFKELKPKLNINTDMSQIINDCFLNIKIFKRIRVIDKLRFVIYSVLIWFELLSSSTVATWTNIKNSFRCYSTRYDPIYKSNSVRSSAINRNVLRFLFSFQKPNIFWIFCKILVKIWVINWINSVNEIFVLIVRWIFQTTWN